MVCSRYLSTRKPETTLYLTSPLEDFRIYQNEGWAFDRHRKVIRPRRRRGAVVDHLEASGEDVDERSLGRLAREGR